MKPPKSPTEMLQAELNRRESPRELLEKLDKNKPSLDSLIRVHTADRTQKEDNR